MSIPTGPRRRSQTARLQPSQAPVGLHWMGSTKGFGSSGAFRNRAHPAYWSFEMAVTVRDALSLGGLQRGEVLAGASGLDPEITLGKAVQSPQTLVWLDPARP